MEGRTISGRYRIVRRIGAGGGGDVYEADDTELRRRVAIKFLTDRWGEDRKLKQRFLREAEALSALDHPHICTIFEAGETRDGRMYIVMAYYPGQNLKVRLNDGGLSLSESVTCGVAIADAMDFAHRKGFLHRDLKPGNIVVTEDWVVKILDFGLAKLPDRTQMTDTGVAVGTLAYAPPEQAMGKGVDTRSDIYSLGVILYQMVTGICPFSAPSAAATLQMVLNDTPAPVAEVKPDVPAELADWIERSMAKDPQERPASMAELREGLLGVLGRIEPAQATRLRAEHVEYDSTVDRKRSRTIPLLAISVFLFALLGGVWKMGWLEGITGSGVENAAAGIAVLPLESRSSAPGSSPLATGLWIDLNARVMRMADHDPELWVAPAWRVQDFNADEVADGCGVSRVLTGTVRSAEAGLAVDLKLLDALTGTEIRSARDLVPDKGSGLPESNLRLAELLGIGLEPSQLRAIDAEYTREPRAWRLYLRGLGLLGPQGRGDAEQALAAFRSAIEIDPGFREARLRYAEALWRRGVIGRDPGDFDRALAILDSASMDVPGNGAMHALRGQVLGSRGEADASIAELDSAVESCPGNPEYRRLLGWELYTAGDNVRAEQVYRDAIAENPGYAGSYEDLGYFFWTQERYPEAISAYEKVVELAPGYGPARNSLGACYYSVDRWEEATEMYEESFALGRNFAACNNLGTLYYMDGRFEEAAHMQEWALEYQPSNYVIVGNIAAARTWLPGQKVEAQRLMAKAAKLAEEKRLETPDDPDLLVLLAGYYAQSKPEKAVELAVRALELAPKKAEILYRVALVYEEVGQRTKAIRALGDAIAAGYSLRIIAHERLLKDLREDPRYRLLLP